MLTAHAAHTTDLYTLIASVSPEKIAELRQVAESDEWPYTTTLWSDVRIIRQAIIYYGRECLLD